MQVGTPQNAGAITCHKFTGSAILNFSGYSSIDFGSIPVTGSNIGSGGSGSGFATNANNEYIVDKTLQLGAKEIAWTGYAGEQFGM